MSSDESWIAVQIDEVLDRVAEDAWVEQVQDMQCRLVALLTRAEEIRALRDRQGKKLGKAAQAELREILSRITELAELLLQTLPPEQRLEWEGRLKWL